MIVLAIESATDRGGVALLDGDRVLAERTFERGMVHGRAIAPSIAAILAEGKLEPAAIELIAVDVGPGSYTGVRVGLASAKGFALALGRPVAGVLSLDAMGAGTACAVIDAKWKQVYAATYRDGAREGGPWALTPEELKAKLPAGMAIREVGCGKWIGSFEGRAVARDAFPEAATVGRLGLAKFRSRGPDEAAALAPAYLRPTEAEVKAGIPGVRPS